MRVRLRVWLQITTVAVAYSSSDFLRSTLDKIQQERLENMIGETTQNSTNNEYDGEIVFEADDNSLDPHSHNYEITFSNNVDYQDQEGQMNSQYKQPAHSSQSTNSLGGSTNEGEVQGYYYYFYPLQHYTQSKPNKPTTQHGTPAMNESDMMNMVMDSMMKTSMMTKSETPVAPLFRAVTWFIGTAMLFVVTILLLPKFRVKKAKEIFQERNAKAQISQTIPDILSNIFMLPPVIKEKQQFRMLY